jgi:hypothetical protein
MRMLRALTIAASVVVLPSLAGAQEGRQFKDAWFWGVKAGGFGLANVDGQYTVAPMVGFEWLITRTHGALYLSASQAFFNQQTLAVRDPNFPSDSGVRVINMTNMRKFDAAIMAFPGEHNRWHPYAGIGFTLNMIASAAGQPPFGNVDQLTFTQDMIQNSKVSFSPLGIVGAQYRFPEISVFGQASLNATQHNFLLYNGQPVNFSLEFGVRYNVGTSIDRSN